jgi:uncharacterized protein
MRKMQLKGSTALVTGASSGIGRCFANDLARAGCHLVIVARSAEKLEQLASELSSGFGVRVVCIPQDLAKPGAAADIFRQAELHGLTVDVLVNNAGVGLFGPAINQSPELIRSMIEVNVHALTELCLLFAKGMQEKKSGAILNVASMVALMPTPFFSTYAASKAYVKSFSATLRAELMPSGVRVGCLFPGYVKTNFDSASRVTSQAYARFSNSMGMEPEKVAAAGVRLLKSGRAKKTAGTMNAIASFFVGLIPAKVLAWFSFRFLSGIVSR